MKVGDVDERDIAKRVETQQISLAELLLRKGARPGPRQDRCSCGGNFKKLAPRRHGKGRGCSPRWASAKPGSSAAAWTRQPRISLRSILAIVATGSRMLNSAPPVSPPGVRRRATRDRVRGRGIRPIK